MCEPSPSTCADGFNFKFVEWFTEPWCCTRHEKKDSQLGNLGIFDTPGTATRRELRQLNLHTRTTDARLLRTHEKVLQTHFSLWTLKPRFVRGWTWEPKNQEYTTEWKSFDGYPRCQDESRCGQTSAVSANGTENDHCVVKCVTKRLFMLLRMVLCPLRLMHRPLLLCLPQNTYTYRSEQQTITTLQIQ